MIAMLTVYDEYYSSTLIGSEENQTEFPPNGNFQKFNFKKKHGINLIKFNEIRLERTDIVKLLIESDTNSMNQIAQIDKDLYDYKMNSIPTEGKTYQQFIRQLVMNVENFNAVDKNGNTALHRAIEQGK